jgi:hypothetical protein
LRPKTTFGDFKFIGSRLPRRRRFFATLLSSDDMIACAQVNRRAAPLAGLPVHREIL